MNEKKFKKNYVIQKRNLKKEGNFFQASNSILLSRNLTDSAKILLFLITSTSFEKIHLSYFQKILGWSNEKLSNAVKSLKKNGNLIVDKKSAGYGNGFDYNYIISEYGDLHEMDENFEETVLGFINLIEIEKLEKIIKKSNGNLFYFYLLVEDYTNSLKSNLNLNF